MSGEEGFVSRWSRRKALVREGRATPEAAPVPVEPPPAAPPPATVSVVQAVPEDAPDTAARPPPPTLEDAQALTPASDFTRFVARDVDPAVKNTALKALFADPQFNVMDGLDTYIDDYNKPDPLPESMLRQMVQSQFLGLFRDEEKPAEAVASAAPALPVAPGAPKETTDDEDADLRLQPDDAAGPTAAGAPEPGTGEDPGRVS
jgi:hypothetical protein